MDLKHAIADFQLIANRVSKFCLVTNDLSSESGKVKVNYDMDYNILDIEQKENSLAGKLEYMVDIKAEIQSQIFFEIQLVMEGIFIGDKNKLNQEEFLNRMELNGVASLSHLSRSYIISATSLAGMNPPIKIPMTNIHLLMEMKKNKEGKMDKTTS